MPKNNKVIVSGGEYETARCACGFHMIGFNLGMRIKLHRKVCPVEAQAKSMGINTEYNKFETTVAPSGASRVDVVADIYRQRAEARFNVSQSQ
jgi:hypothetical protein